MAEYDENGEVEETSGPKALRDELQKVKDQVASLAEENAALKQAQRERAISDHISSKGLNAKVAGLIPADVAGDPASIDAWLEKYGDVFGVSQTPADDPDDNGEDDVDAETKAAHQRVADATAGGDTQGRSVDLDTRLANAKTREELDAILAEAR